MIEGAALALKVGSYGVKAGGAFKAAMDPTTAFIAKRDQQDIEWWGEVVQAVAHLQQRMSAHDRERVSQRLLGDDEAIGVLANYVDAANEEPLHERRRMLHHAAAGLANLSLSVAQHARVQRVLRELDADDLVVLYRVAVACGHLKEGAISARDVGVLRLKLWEGSGAESLESSGCIRVVAKGGGAGVGTHEELHVTRTGITVLRALRSYIKVRNPDLSTTPGHEMPSPCRSEPEARGEIARISGLYESLMNERGAGFAGITYQCSTELTDALADRKALLVVSLPQKVVLDLQAQTSSGGAEQDKGTTSIFVEQAFQDHQDSDRMIAHIAGPHDILRFLAYDLDAWWA